MRLSLFLNELSICNHDGGVDCSDKELLGRLARVVFSIRRAVARHHRGSLRVGVVPDIGTRQLPSGSTVLAAVQAIKSEDELLFKILLQVLTIGPWVDVQVSSVWTCRGAPAPGLGSSAGAAVPSLSFDLEDWRVSPLLVQQSPSPAREVLNLWNEASHDGTFRSLPWQEHVLPLYEDPGHHDPSCGKYRTGKSHIPENAETVLEYAVPANTTTWWARCEHGFYHRFMGSESGAGRVVVHWNGTTNTGAIQPTRLEDVPKAVRAELSRFERAAQCGCRELPGS